MVAMVSSLSPLSTRVGYQLPSLGLDPLPLLSQPGTVLDVAATVCGSGVADSAELFVCPATFSTCRYRYWVVV